MMRFGILNDFCRWCVSSNHLGAKVRLISNPLEFDVALLEVELSKAANENRLPKAIIPTDLYGMSVDIEGLEKLADRYGIV